MHTQPDGSDEVRRLFHEQSPELAGGIVEIKAIARERGDRSMVAVFSKDPGLDPIGCCVGQGGTRIKAVVKQLAGEHIEIFRWSESAEDFIRNALFGVVIRRIELDTAAHCAVVTVDSKRLADPTIDPTRLRLASKVVGWTLQLVET